MMRATAALVFGIALVRGGTGWDWLLLMLYAAFNVFEVAQSRRLDGD